MDWNIVKEVMKKKGFCKPLEIHGYDGSIIKMKFSFKSVIADPEDAEYVPDYNCIINENGEYYFIAQSPTNSLCTLKTNKISCFEIEKKFNEMKEKYEEQLKALQQYGMM